MARILVVEEEWVVARDLQRSLAALGHDVPSTAASAEQALLLASEQRPDLVLMDVRIKGERDGIETARMLRARFAVPILYLTAYSDPATVERAKATEPYGYLLKPVNANELRSAVEIALYKHRMEQLAHEREQWLQAVLRSIGDAVVSVDVHGNIHSMNPAAEALTGWAEAHALGRASGEVFRVIGDERPGVVTDPLGLCRREGQTVHLSGRLLPQQGRPAMIQSITTPLRGQRGDSIGAVAVFRDVSEEMRLQRRVDAMDRLAALGTMAAGLIHQLRTPLALVVASLRSAREALANPSPARKGDGVGVLVTRVDELDGALATAEWGSERAHCIVADLGRMARRNGVGARTTVDLHEPLDRAIELVHEFMPGVRVIVEAGEVPAVSVDAAQLAHVLSHLLIGAAETMSDLVAEVSLIRVATRTDERGRALVEIVGAGDRLPPVSAAQRSEPPSAGESKEPGEPDEELHGDALLACRGVVRSFGGDIEFEARPGGATTVRVALPARDPESSRQGDRPGADAYVLVVEHEPLARSVISRALGGHLVTWAKHAGDGLALLQGGMRFDLILCDLDLPDLGGVQLYREVERSLPDQAGRVLFLTGGTSDPEVQELLGSATNWRLDKPLHAEQLRDAIRAALGQAGRCPREECT